MLTNLLIQGTPFAIDHDGYLCETNDGRAGDRCCEWYEGPELNGQNIQETQQAEAAAEERLLETLRAGGVEGTVWNEEVFIGWHDNGACYARVGEPIR